MWKQKTGACMHGCIYISACIVPSFHARSHPGNLFNSIRSLVKMDLFKKIPFMFLLLQVVLSGVVSQTNLIHHNNGLSYGFYDQSCPQLEGIVRTAIQAFLLSDPTTAAALLRLMFHDCQVQVCVCHWLSV